MGEPRRNHLVAVIVGVVFLLYVTSYVALSRRGYAEMDRWNASGFYYFSPEDTDAWRFRNTACIHVFWPLNAIDRAIGVGRAPAHEPLWSLSG